MIPKEFEDIIKVKSHFNLEEEYDIDMAERFIASMLIILRMDGEILPEDEIEVYGKYKAKISDKLYEKLKDKENGKLILVTAMSPTPLGE